MDSPTLPFVWSDRSAFKSLKRYGGNELPSEMIALEPRVMLDGAAAVAAVSEATDENADNGGADKETTDPAAQAANSESDNGGTHSDPVEASHPGPVESQSVVIVDASIKDAETLLTGIDPAAHIVYLSAGSDGVQQITDILSGLSNVTDLHILSHGSTGSLTLGATTLDTSNIESYASQFVDWDVALADGGDILLYGCNVGQDGAGMDFIDLFADLTNADVAASSDLTGHESLGGDWDLELSTGAIQAPVAISEAAQAAFRARLVDIVVTTATDENDGPAAGTGLSLREALVLAQNGDTIRFDASVFSVDDDITNNETIDLSLGELVISQGVRIAGDIDGDGNADVTVDGGGATRILSVARGTADVALDGLVIRNGNSGPGDSVGGGLMVNFDTTVAVTNSTISGNTAARGGGIYSSGTLTLDSSTISGNYVRYFGGGIYNRAGSLALNNSTISGNIAANSGAGIFNNSYSPLTIDNSTISGNRARFSGGGIEVFFFGTTTINNSIIAGNSAGYSGTDFALRSPAYVTVNSNGANIFGSDVAINTGGDVELGIGGNTNTLADVFADVGTVTLGGASFEAGLLADNGGPVQTIALNASGIAVDAGLDGVTVSPTDARGFNRNVDVPGTGIDGAANIIDIGAVEVQVPNAVDDGFTIDEDPATALVGNVLADNGNGADTDPEGGTLTVMPETVTTAGGATVDILADGSFTYTPAGNFAGNDSFQYTLISSRGTQSTGTVNVTVNPVNDAPAGADATITVTADTARPFSAADFGFTDANDNPANGLFEVIVTTLPAGTLTLNGIQVAMGQAIPVSELGSLVYRRPAGGLGTGADSFSFQVRDDGGTDNNAQDTDQTPNTITFDIAEAASLVVTTADDDVDRFDGVTSLREALAVAQNNETISFDNNVFLVDDDITNNETIGLSLGELVISQGVRIAGDIDGDGNADVTVDGGNATRIFSVAFGTANVALDGLVIRNGNSGTANGGGLLVNFGASATVTNSTISDNTTATVGFGPYLGGGIYNAGTLTLDDSSVSDNVALNRGGGIYNRGMLTLTNSTISGNRVFDRGGGISSQYGAVTLSGSTISDNNASQDGGGIYSYGAVVTITGSTISGNTSQDNGGGIHAVRGALTASRPSTVTITGSTISGNTAQDFGGGIYNTRGTVSIASSTISDNDALETGGGIYNTRGTVTITGSTVSGNTAQDDGGGIYNRGVTGNQAVLTITNSTISGNLARRDGGGIDNNGTLTLTNSTISGNRADNSNGGLADNNGSTINNTIIAGNSARFSGDDVSFTLATSNGANIFGSDVFFNVAGDIELGVPGNTNTLSDVFADVGSVTVGGTTFNAGLLADNGGPVGTIALNLTGIAVDAGKAADIAGFPTDARGVARQIDRPGIGNDGPMSPDIVDIGAFEVQAPPTANDDGFSTDEEVVLVGNVLADNGNGADTDPEGGALSVRARTFVTGNGGSVMLLADGSFTYTPAANFVGTDGFGYTLVGSAFGEDSGTVTVIVNPVNDAPSGADGTIAVTGDTPRPFSAADFGFTDANDSPANGLFEVIVTTLPTGTLTLNGIQVTAGQAIPASALGQLVYTRPAGGVGVGADSLTFQVRDDGGTGNNGENTDQTPNTITFDIAEAGSLVVTTADDDVDQFDGVTSLREALGVAQNGETISFDQTVFTVDTDVTNNNSIGLNSITNGGFGELVISQGVRIAGDIDGDGNADVTVDGSDATRVFSVATGTANVALDGLVIRNGNSGAAYGAGLLVNAGASVAVTHSTISGNTVSATALGGGIFNRGDLTLDNSTISDNVAGRGGGIFNFGDVTLNRSTVSGNVAVLGGGIHNRSTMVVDNSTISDNNGRDGGGIYNLSNLTIDNSTISGNTANAIGGGILTFSDMTLENSTISGNRADSGGGGLYISAGVVSVNNSILVGNDAGNAAGSSGGGIDNRGILTLDSATVSGNMAGQGGGISNSGDLDAVNSTISGNLAGQGGGISNSGDLDLDNSTISGNRAGSDGGGLFVSGGAASVSNSIIAGNAGNSDDDVGGSVVATSNGANIFGSDVSGNTGGDIELGIGGNTDTLADVFADVGTVTVGGASFEAGLLADNGGPRQTIALNPTGIAVDAGLDGVSVSLTDARGFERTVDIPGIGNNGAANIIDIGAFEVQTPPTAATDTFVTDEDIALAGNVLDDNGNGADVDPLGGALSVRAETVTSANGATIVLQSDGSFIYTPPANFTGNDNFNYTLIGSNGGLATGTVDIGVNPVNDAPVATDDSVATDADLAFGEDEGNRAITADILGNDSDLDTGDVLTVDAIDTTGTRGTVTLVGGVISYDPNGAFEALATGQSTVDTFTYTVSDGNGGTDNATVSITINGANDAPDAVDDSVATDTDLAFGEDDGVRAITGDILGNDSDPDTGDVFTITAIDTTGTLGTATFIGGVISYDPNGAFQALAAGETAVDTFTYTISDGNGGTNTATVSITINGANDAPDAVDDSVATNADLAFGEDDGNRAITADILGNDSDPDTNDVLTVSAINTAGTLGTVTLVGDVISYDPSGAFEALAAGQSAVDTFTYTVSDGRGGTDTATVSITINGANDAPVAVDDSVATDTDLAFGEDDGARAITADILGNDSDPDTGGVFSVTAIDTAGTLGTATLVGGVVSYNPNGAFHALAAGETAVDTFTYTIDDGNGGTNTATVSITINGANDGPNAVDDSVASDADLAFGEDEGNRAITADILGNDSDPDASDMLTVTAIDTTGTRGTATLVGGVLSYNPNGAFQALGAGRSTVDTFTYTIDDGNGGTDTATVSITINGANDAPVAVDDSVATDSDLAFGEDDGVRAITADIFGNDSDPDAGDLFSVTAIDTTGTLGTATLAGGVLSYNPSGAFQALAAGETAVDTFTYTIDDGNGGTDTATVSITINGANDGPDAVDDSAATDADLAFGEDDGNRAITADILGNDSDPDASDMLTVTAIDTTGMRGTATLVGGVISYNPNGAFQALGAGRSAVDTFTYTISDGNGGTDTATVNITINGANDAPVAVDDSVATDSDLAFGEDDGARAITADIFGNDSDPDAGDLFSVTAIDTTGTRGTVTLVGGVLSYNPNGAFQALGAGQSAVDTFTYTISDGNGGTDTATVSITINGANDAPVAVDDSVATDSDLAFGEDDGARAITADILGNDSDPDAGDLFSVTAIDTTGTSGTATLVGGVISYNPNGAFQTLAAGETAVDTFTYTIDDGNGGTNTATVSITINGANDAPGAVDDSVATDADLAFGEDDANRAITADILGNDSDPDTSDVLTVSAIDTTGTRGTVTLVGGVISYDPSGAFQALATGQSTVDTFTYTVSDGNGGTDNATVSITINGANDAPDAVDDSVATDTDLAFGEDDGVRAITGDILGNDSDPDTGDVFTVTTIDTTGTLGTATLVGGVVSYNPNGAFQALAAGETAVDTFTYTIDDGNGGTNTATVSITINGANDAPDAVDDSAATDADLAFAEDEGNRAITGDILGNDSDPDSSDVLTVTAIDTTGTRGTATLVGGVLSYNPNGAFQALAAGQSAVDTFTYTISDGNGGTDTATVSITINGANDAPVNTVPGAQATSEETALVFSAAAGNGLSISDADAGNSDVTTTLTVASGTLAVTATGTAIIGNDGSNAVTITGTIAEVNAALASVTYTPVPDFNGADTLTITTNDGGNAGAGVALIDTDTVTITVNPVNDAPVNSVPGPQATENATDLVFSAAAGNLISISDVDAGGGVVTTTLTVPAGTLAPASGSGAAIAGSGTAALTITGTLAQVNAALSAITFTPDGVTTGTIFLTVTTNDNGSTGAGGNQTDADQIEIQLASGQESPGTDGRTSSSQIGRNNDNQESNFSDTPGNPIGSQNTGPGNTGALGGLPLFGGGQTVDPITTAGIGDQNRTADGNAFSESDLPGSIALDSSSDTGISDSDNTTRDATPLLTGEAPANAIVTITSSLGGILGTAVTDENGRWSFTAPNLSDGVHELIATPKDEDGNEGVPSLPLLTTIDTLAPSTPPAPSLDGDADQLRSNDTPTFKGTAEPGARIVLTSDPDGIVGEVIADENGNWEIATDPLSENIHKLSITATDPAGNTSSASAPLEVVVGNEDDTALNFDSAPSNLADFTAPNGSLGFEPIDLTALLSGFADQVDVSQGEQAGPGEQAGAGLKTHSLGFTRQLQTAGDSWSQNFLSSV